MVIFMTANSHNKGFTLVEVIIATIILILSLLGGVAFFNLNRNNLSYANYQRLATWAAIYKIEELKSMPYPPASVSDTWQYKGVTFTRIPTIVNDPTGNYKQATVSVSWVQGSFPSSLTKLSLTTYISERL